MTDPLLPLLKQTFGYDSFRPLQREIIAASLAGRDAVAILPTGAGKSLCFQLPALARPGVTLVISPLIALMKDQVDALTASGVAATFLNSSLAASEVQQRRSGLENGQYKLLYAAPERVMAQGFAEDLQRWNVTAIAVDEAHCISEWGHDFRPEYRQLAQLRSKLPGVPILALTATATEQVRGHCSLAALTRSDQGSLVLEGELTHLIPIYGLGPLVDTTGAGDSYAAGFLYGYTQGLSAERCGHIGALCAGQVVTQMGPRSQVSLKELVLEHLP